MGTFSFLVAKLWSNHGRNIHLPVFLELTKNELTKKEINFVSLNLNSFMMNKLKI